MCYPAKWRVMSVRNCNKHKSHDPLPEPDFVSLGVVLCSVGRHHSGWAKKRELASLLLLLASQELVTETISKILINFP